MDDDDSDAVDDVDDLGGVGEEMEKDGEDNNEVSAAVECWYCIFVCIPRQQFLVGWDYDPPPPPHAAER